MTDGTRDMERGNGGAGEIAIGLRMRYVVLHHTGIAHPHFDLMLEPPDAKALLTWRIALPPGEWASAGVGTAERLPDHRLVYMTFEGAISGNRGNVTRVAGGEAMVVGMDGERVRLRLEGGCEVALPVV